MYHSPISLSTAYLSVHYAATFPQSEEAFMQHSDSIMRVDALRKALKAHALVLAALERTTVNMPPIQTHWEHWRTSPLLKLLG